MIPEFLQDLLHCAEGKIYSTDSGVYVVADSFDEAKSKIEGAFNEDVFELVSVISLPDH